MHVLSLLLANPAVEIAGVIVGVLVFSHLGADRIAPDVRLVPARLTPEEARRHNRAIELRLAREALAGPLGGLERRELLARIAELERELGCA